MFRELFDLRLALLPLCALLATACSDPETGGEVEDDDALSAPDEQCLSGMAWIGGTEGSPHMNPGLDCLTCHQSLGVEEEVVLGGTVYGALNETDRCFGVEGVTLELTDADGEVTEVVSNEAGNFVLEHVDIATPYAVTLRHEGRERVMEGHQSVLSCNSCHTQTGTNAAPGRILAP